MIIAATLATLLLTQAAGQTPQPKPDFSGIWVPIAGVNPVVELTVTQTADTLTARAGTDAAHMLSVRLDGVESTQNDGAVVSKAQWDGPRLVVTHAFKATRNLQRQVWSVDASGILTIETSREQNGNVTRTNKSTYKRR